MSDQVKEEVSSAVEVGSPLVKTMRKYSFEALARHLSSMKLQKSGHCRAGLFSFDLISRKRNAAQITWESTSFVSAIINSSSSSSSTLSASAKNSAMQFGCIETSGHEERYNRGNNSGSSSNISNGGDDGGGGQPSANISRPGLAAVEASLSVAAQPPPASAFSGRSSSSTHHHLPRSAVSCNTNSTGPQSTQ